MWPESFNIEVPVRVADELLSYRDESVWSLEAADWFEGLSIELLAAKAQGSLPLETP